MEPSFGEEWKPTAVIEVGMGEEHKVDLRGIEAKWRCILIADICATLKQPTVHEDMFVASGDEKARTSDTASCAMKCNLHC